MGLQRMVCHGVHVWLSCDFRVDMAAGRSAGFLEYIPTKILGKELIHR